MKKEPNTPFNSTKLFIHIKEKNRDRENFYFVVVLERKLLYNMVDISIIGKNNQESISTQ